MNRFFPGAKEKEVKGEASKSIQRQIKQNLKMNKMHFFLIPLTNKTLLHL